MRFHKRKYFTRHVSGEAQDLGVAYLGPLAVRAGQTDPRTGGRKSIQCADDLGFLSTHHVRGAGWIARGKAGYDPSAAPRRTYLAHAGSDLLCTGRATRIRQLGPSLPAADHSTHHYGSRIYAQPIADLAFQCVRELALFDIQDPERCTALLGHAAVLGEPIGSEARRTPIDGYHCFKVVIRDS